ncbi:hypothetical protein [Halocatena marina]|uniref:hypothetical protein n=1 Tax=Halocatena marina TaxID=2934937 RepID=UPI00200BF1EC|nr:hypothetical protein [Halocatena marina]
MRVVVTDGLAPLLVDNTEHVLDHPLLLEGKFSFDGLVPSETCFQTVELRFADVQLRAIATRTALTDIQDE